jgi:hypothetical protein
MLAPFAPSDRRGRILKGEKPSDLPVVQSIWRRVGVAARGARAAPRAHAAHRCAECPTRERSGIGAANLHTAACDERSAMNVATVGPLPAAALMRAETMRVLALLRPTWRRSRLVRRALLPPQAQCHWWHP